MEEVGEIFEQYLRMLSPELQVWIQEHDAKTAAQAITLADVFVAARKRSQWAWKASSDDRRLNLNQQSQRNFPSAGQSLGGPVFANPKKLPISYLCGQEGHTKPMCPKNTAKTSHLCYVPRGHSSSQEKSEWAPQMVTMEVNGRELQALVDTGSVQTLVHHKYVPPALLNFSEKKAICCVHGDEKLLPTSNVYIKVRGQTYLMDVGVADNLPFLVFLGHDLPVLWDLLQPVPSCNIVVIRAKARKGEEEQLLRALPFFDQAIDTVDSAKPRKSRRQRRWGKVQYNASKMPADSFSDFSTDFKLPTNIAQ